MEWYQQYGAVYRAGEGASGSEILSIFVQWPWLSMTARHFVRRWPKGVAVHFSFVWIPIPKDKRYPFHHRRNRGTRHNYWLMVCERLCVTNVLWLIEALGSVHNDSEKFVGPAFAASQLRLFLKVFQASALNVRRYTDFYGISSFEHSSL